MECLVKWWNGQYINTCLSYYIILRVLYPSVLFIFMYCSKFLLDNHIWFISGYTFLTLSVYYMLHFPLSPSQRHNSLLISRYIIHSLFICYPRVFTREADHFTVQNILLFLKLCLLEFANIWRCDYYIFRFALSLPVNHINCYMHNIQLRIYMFCRYKYTSVVSIIPDTLKYFSCLLYIIQVDMYVICLKWLL